ncbi:glycoside hydrolase family 16 protein [Carboxylicivirga sp. M1479]|uniref:glycoside hydrolase family 16 protein n=1 Tax=Carboxylicivirga sp. M1479 TaxID=2594476 RepID=UPI00117811FD|nr:glycoside hydrolase family 16 protein [Carboxylicivirga sp. M1479]TRX62371.1 glycoside hydrolase family 16 protein [Carboxylicivirga sp. M1479]
MLPRYCLFIIVLLIFDEIKCQKSFSKESIIEFSGFLWHKKEQYSKVGPGPNYFGLHKNNVIIDKKGRLHLKVKRHKGAWSCAEISTDSILKEGKYEVSFYCSRAKMPSNLVLGLFLYDKKNAPSYNEVDFELSKWNKAESMNAQYVVYNDTSLCVKRFDLSFLKQETKLTFLINSDSITVSSSWLDDRRLIYKSTFVRPTTFEPRQLRFRMNLWLIDSVTNRLNPFDVIITSFDYTEL